MRHRIITLAEFFLFILLIFPTIRAADFGHVSVFADESVTEQDISEVQIKIEGDVQSRNFGGRSSLVLWDIHPGKHNIELIFRDNRKTRTIEIVVYPGMTSRIYIIKENDSIKLIDFGFADKTGHVFTFDRESINAFPGELGDGIGLLKSSISGRDSYAYDGLEVSESSRERNFIPGGKTYSDYALINLSNPFAGYSNAGVSLISNFDGLEKMSAEGVYGSRDRRFYRITAGHKLPRGIGTFFGALNFENLEDAMPRWNVDGRLPHNGAENIEVLGGAGFNVNSRIKADIRMFYEKYKREYYQHSYYFNLDHAPREEGILYNGKASLYGWLYDNLFARAGFGIHGDDNKRGDGVYLDDILSYQRPGPDGNPSFDRTALFYSWDDIDSVTANMDESHVYGDYHRYKTSGINFDFGLHYILNQNYRLSLDAAYSGDAYREYRNIFPTIPFFDNVINIGFDSLGLNENEENGFTGVPKPKRLDISFEVKGMVLSSLSFSGSLDYIRFNPGTLMLRSYSYPFDPSGGNDLEFDESDMQEAAVESKLGFRLAGVYSLNDVSLLKDFDIFVSYSKQFDVPEYSNLYMDYDYFNYKVIAGGYYYVFGNPELELQKRQCFEGGIRFELNDHSATISFQHISHGNAVTPVTIPAYPKAYTIYANSSDKVQIPDSITSNALVISYQKYGNSFYNMFLLAELAWDNYKNNYPSNIAWTISGITEPDYSGTNYKLAGGIMLRPYNYLKSHSNRNSMINKIMARTEWDVSFSYKSGPRYTPMLPNAGPVGFYDESYSPSGSIKSGEFDDRFEVNVGLTAKVLEIDQATLSLRFEVLNLLDKNNYIAAYPATGSPDNTGWLNTDGGQIWIDAHDTVDDSSGLTGEQKYLLRQDDPNNFGRPRIIRFLARLEF